MSILLSAYYPEGIVFVADKNATISYSSLQEKKRYVEPTATKVLSWPRQKAIVGFVGLGELAGLPLYEWMRVFIASTRDFKDIARLAKKLKNAVQKDFQKDHPDGTDVSESQLIIHLGGFTKKQGVHVPVMYHIWNHGGIDANTGSYPLGERQFRISEDVKGCFENWPNPNDYPKRVRDRLQNMINERRYFWFNNGANIGAFNVFKDFIWHALQIIQDAGFATKYKGLGARVAFCKMAVEVFGVYFTHHFFPEDRAVGGGVDVAFIPWPKTAA